MCIRDSSPHRLPPSPEGRSLAESSAPLPGSTAPESADAARTCPRFAESAQPDHLVPRQVGHVHPAEERQHMVFAQTKKLNVLHHYHGVVLYFVQCTVDDPLDVHLIAAGEKPEGLAHSFW